MTTFILFAIVLTIAAVAVVVVPLLRKTSGAAEPAVGAAFAVTGVLIFGAAALYAVWSNWSWQAAAETADSPQNMVSRLARRLERNPDDLNGWLMLGRSYTVLEQYPLAVRAYQRADRLAGGQNAEALVGMAEALVLTDETELDGRAGQYIEKALELDPKSGKAQFYGAAAALRRGDLPLARERFTNLLALDPPANVRPILEQQINAIDQQLAASGQAAGTKAAAGPRGSSAPSAPQGSGADASRTADARGASKSAPAKPVAAVRVHVTLSAKLSDSVPSDAPLFVLVRDPRQAGPPLAVKRLTSRFPQDVELTTEDTMLPGRTFAPGQLVEVVARVSKSGNPVAASGDLFGLAAHRVGEGGVVDIEIAHVTP